MILRADQTTCLSLSHFVGQPATVDLRVRKPSCDWFIISQV